jgi:hypothetical protein
VNTREALVRLGDRPIKHSPISKSLVASLNAHLEPTDQDCITLDTPGDEALTRVYRHPNRERILTEEWGVIRDRDSFRLLLILVAVGLTLLVFSLAVIEVYGSVRGSPGRGVELLDQITSILQAIGSGVVFILSGGS